MDTVAPLALYAHIGSPRAPLLLDVRYPATFEGARHMIPGALHAGPDAVGFTARHAADRPIVVYCPFGRNGGPDAVEALSRAG